MYKDRKYIPSDNSYLEVVESKNSNVTLNLAGDNSEYPKETVIVSEPYESVITIPFLNLNATYKFVNVEFEENVYKVLFSEENVDVNPFDRLSSHRDMKKEGFTSIFNNREGTKKILEMNGAK